MQEDILLIMELNEALGICRSLGWDAEVEYVAPPRGEKKGRYRVLRYRKINDHRLLLTAAREGIDKGYRL